MRTKKQINKVAVRVFLVAMLVALGFLSHAKYKQWQSYRDLQRQITLLREEEQRIEDQNSQLEKSLDLLVSDQANEKIARMQLNLKKEGETSVVFVEGEPESVVSSKEGEPQKSNPRLWWDYFFSRPN